jgi:hypothetical protein
MLLLKEAKELLINGERPHVEHTAFKGWRGVSNTSERGLEAVERLEEGRPFCGVGNFRCYERLECG